MQPARSTASCWWVQRQGEDGQASGEEGLDTNPNPKPNPNPKRNPKPKPQQASGEEGLEPNPNPSPKPKQASGEEGLVSRSHLKPLSAEDLQRRLRKEADALRQQVEREAAKREIYLPISPPHLPYISQVEREAAKREAEASKQRARRDP